MNEELAKAKEALRAHLASWKYAFAMAAICQGGKDYPVFVDARKKADELVCRLKELEKYEHSKEH